MKIVSERLVIYPDYITQTVWAIIFDGISIGKSSNSILWVSRVIRETREVNEEIVHTPWAFDDSLIVKNYRMTVGYKPDASISCVNWAFIEPLRAPYLSDAIIRTVYADDLYKNYVGGQRTWTVKEIREKIEYMGRYTPEWWQWMEISEREEEIRQVAQELSDIYRISFSEDKLSKTLGLPYS